MRTFPSLQGLNFVPLKVSPSPNYACRRRFGEDDGLSQRRDLLQGSLVTVIVFGSTNDDEVGLGQFAE